MRRWLPGLGILSLAAVATAATAPSPPASQPAADGAVARAVLARQVAPAIDKALRFLAARQADDGGWEGAFGKSDPAITALVAKAFAQHPGYGPGHPLVRRAVRLVLSFQQDDGGIYDPKVGYANYSTSVALMALSSMKSPEFAASISAAQHHLTGNQWTEGKCDNDGRDINPAHPWYGGAGYGSHRRPDLSNTQLMLEALHQSGLPADDPAYQKALTFIARCQMSGRTNDQAFAAGAEDGGFVYTPANGGESKAGTDTTEGQARLRTYGSMTYAGFKSMLYANVGREDPRVRTAWDWIRRYYTLESNPNMPGAQSKEGLYYYYHIFAKGLEAWGEPFVIDATGHRHDWRAELCARLLELQQPDGSWVNPTDRWQEGNPHLVTAYAVLALQTAIQ